MNGWFDGSRRLFTSTAPVAVPLTGTSIGTMCGPLRSGWVSVSPTASAFIAMPRSLVGDGSWPNSLQSASASLGRSTIARGKPARYHPAMPDDDALYNELIHPKRTRSTVAMSRLAGAPASPPYHMIVRRDQWWNGRIRSQRVVRFGRRSTNAACPRSAHAVAVWMCGDRPFNGRKRASFTPSSHRTVAKSVASVSG